MHSVEILFTEFVTHNVKRFIVEKPEGYSFTPGQATDVAVDQPDWQDRTRPFTFTSLNEDKVIEFTIKEYPDHNGVTQKLHSLTPGDSILVGDPWGTIQFKGSGVFIAGGAGITPFIAIFRDQFLKAALDNSSLIFANHHSKDVILEKELREIFPSDHLHLILTRESGTRDHKEYEQAYIDREYLEKTVDDFSQHFYVCGPKKMVAEIKDHLTELGAESNSLIFEG